MRAISLCSLILLLACAGGKEGSNGGGGEDGSTVADGDGDGFFDGEDCNDNDAAVHPGAPELCDALDNNCDGSVDEGVETTWYPDQDGDGFGDPDQGEVACAQPAGSVPTGTDCDDANSGVRPGAEEQCDGLDNDCDEEVDEGVGDAFYYDADGDGHGDAGEELIACELPDPSYVTLDDDCDDDDASAFPGAEEVCDEVDNDCDGAVDEGVESTFYVDVDGDGWGEATLTTEACATPAGYAADPGDCDDGAAEISPDAVEVCDYIDNDCDGFVDDDDSDTVDPALWYFDEDADGYGLSAMVAEACNQPAFYAADDGDCDDGDNTVYPGAPEQCNDVDDDCDSTVDEGITTYVWYEDADLDSYGSSVALADCAQPPGYVSAGGDCDDADGAVFPGATEVCDGDDNDCDGAVDDADSSLSGGTTWYYDGDGDSFGRSSITTTACLRPSGYSALSTDCDDGASSTYPGASELCDGVDNDCDGTADDGVLGTGAACPAVDCKAIYADNPSRGDGSYALTRGTYTCLMSKYGGGWTKVKDNAYVYGTSYDTSYYNTAGFTYTDILFAYDSGSVTAHCTYPGSLTGCNNLGFQLGGASWGVMLNWGSSLCGMGVTDYSSSTSYVGGYDFTVTVPSTTATIRVGTLEGISNCTIGDNPGGAYLDLYVRR